MKIFGCVFFLWAFWSVAGFSITPQELMGKVNVREHAHFVRFTNQGRTFFLRREAYEQLQRMIQAAKKDGITLTVVSAFRSFDDQKRIWERKWNRYVSSRPQGVDRATWILRYSALPGASRHHWGTDVDLVSLQTAFFRTPAGRRIVRWLEENAAQYGFVLTYTAGRTQGHNEEPWHWSYAPLARAYLEAYTNMITADMIDGFAGAEYAQQIDVFSYVLGINPELLP